MRISAVLRSSPLGSISTAIVRQNARHADLLDVRERCVVIFSLRQIKKRPIVISKIYVYIIKKGRREYKRAALSFLTQAIVYMLRAQRPLERDILDILEGTIGSLGYDITRIKLRGEDNNQSLQIMIERKDGKTITVDDCGNVSHQASAMLDVQDPISGGYDLEVSSPGIDRPLTRAKDFSAYIGFSLRAETRIPKEGEKRFKGILKSADETSCVITAEPSRLRPDGGEIMLSYNDIASAKLIYTDALAEYVIDKEKKADRQAS